MPFEVFTGGRTDKDQNSDRGAQSGFLSRQFSKIDGDDLKALFIELNFEDYRKKRTEFSINAKVFERLLNSDLADSQKMAIVGDIDPEVVSKNSSLAAAIGPVLDRSKIKAKSSDRISFAQSS